MNVGSLPHIRNGSVIAADTHAIGDTGIAGLRSQPLVESRLAARMPNEKHEERRIRTKKFARRIEPTTRPGDLSTLGPLDGSPAHVRSSVEGSLQRLGTAEEIANLVLFLCSDLAANMTGGHYVSDGGRTATGGTFSSVKT